MSGRTRYKCANWSHPSTWRKTG